MSFCDELRHATRDLRNRIGEMPFNAELAAGTLDPDVFRGYIVQDAHYLVGFARALALAAAKAPDPEAVAQLAGSAAGAISVERGLHAHYMRLYGVSAKRFEQTGASPACDHYVSFLQRSAALGPFAEAVAALLPCFWIYHEIGRQIDATARPDNPFRAWIDTYAGEAFAESVGRMVSLVDRMALIADGPMRARMHDAFARSSWHEWNFWDSAYHRRGW